jgi:agmatine/peptidylarginine deiminase
MKKLFTLILLLFPAFVWSQTNHRISPLERNMMPAYLQQVQSTNISSTTTPPTSPVRASAEWEEIDALMIVWTTHPSILTQIVQAAQSQTQVLIICSDSNAVQNTLTTAGVPLTNVQCIEAPYNSIWCRDYGQWNIYMNDVDSLALIDWTYNRPRPLDNAVPSVIETYTGLPMYSMTAAPYDLIHTGGNFMVDGFGTGFSSKLIVNENPTKTVAEIDTIMKLYMGIDRYIKMDVLPYDGIHHIDMHLKLLDEETLLVGEYPANTADGPQIEANLLYVLSNFNSVFGTPYKVVRIPMPPDSHGLYPDQAGDYRTYTNSVFVNQTVILPTYDPQYDSTAIRIYQEALPGYNIVGIDCNSIIPSSGAIHCITKEVAAKDQLLISHQPLQDTYNTTTSYVVNSRIQHASGILQADLYYTTDTSMGWQTAAMTNAGGNIWTGSIPTQVAGTTLYYYVEATSVSNKVQRRPMTAPAGYWKFNVLLNTGIESSSTANFSLGNAFPNPSHGITCIPVSTAHNSPIKLTLKNILGEEIFSIYEGMNHGEKKYFMNTSSIATGVYVLELKTETEIFSQKIIVR